MSNISTILKYYSAGAVAASTARQQQRSAAAAAAAMTWCGGNSGSNDTVQLWHRGVLYWKIIICLNVVNGGSNDDPVRLQHQQHSQLTQGSNDTLDGCTTTGTPILKCAAAAATPSRRYYTVAAAYFTASLLPGRQCRSHTVSSLPQHHCCR